ncbi:hypothetical protein C8Q80DRAFT_1124067 [Daedaleopsis nitida]|nr:hypothetical protein C8Q80DRAFT_1124067 [Daedaleopsis nitida]
MAPKLSSSKRTLSPTAADSPDVTPRRRRVRIRSPTPELHSLGVIAGERSTLGSSQGMSSGLGSSPLMTSPELPPRTVHRGRARFFGQATPMQFDWGPSVSMFNPNPPEQQHPTLPEYHLPGVSLSQQHKVIGSSIGEVAIHSESESSSSVGEVAICSDSGSSIDAGEVAIRSDSESSTDVGEVAIRSDSASSSNSGEVAIHSESEVADDEMGDEPDTVQRPQFSGHSVEYRDRLPPRFSALDSSSLEPIPNPPSPAEPIPIPDPAPPADPDNPAADFLHHFGLSILNLEQMTSYGTRENWAEEHENDQHLFMQCGEKIQVLWDSHTWNGRT